MPKKKAPGKDKRVHAAGPVRPLCGAKSTKVSRAAEEITCDACGAAAVKLVEMAQQGEHTRQEAALAAAQPPRWWVKDQVLVEPRTSEAQ